MTHVIGGISHSLSHEDRLVGSDIVVVIVIGVSHCLNSLELGCLRSSLRIPAALIGVCGFTLACYISYGSSASLTL